MRCARRARAARLPSVGFREFRVSGLWRAEVSLARLICRRRPARAPAPRAR